jgi:hypothetical protein
MFKEIGLHLTILITTLHSTMKYTVERTYVSGQEINKHALCPTTMTN